MRGTGWTAFVLALVLVAPAAATEKRPLPAFDLKALPQPEPIYQNLPGVKTPEQIEAERRDGFDCTTVLRTYRNNDRHAGFSRTLPELVYRCEKDGLVVESGDAPRRGSWMPGINPSDARR